MPYIVTDTVVSLRSVSADVARAGLPTSRRGLRRLGSDPSVECIYTTVDVAAVQRNILSMDPRHPGSVKTAFVERIQIASFSLMGN
jgi:hypothetical protein